MRLLRSLSNRIFLASALLAALSIGAALFFVRWFRKKDFTLEYIIGVFRFVVGFAVVVGMHFSEIGELGRNGFVNFNLFFDLLQCFGQTFGGALTQNQSGSVLYDGLYGGAAAFGGERNVIVTLRVDRMHQSLEDAFNGALLPWVVLSFSQ